MKKEISILRIVATLAVLFMHCSNSMTANNIRFGVNSTQYSFFAICTVLMMWAVPVFFMMSGNLLLNSNKKFTVNQIVKKYVSRMILALFVFGVPFSIMELVANSKTINSVYIFDSIVNVVNGDSWDHLWYLYAMIGIYIVLPAIKPFVIDTDKKNLFHFIIALFLFNVVFPFINILAGTKIYFTLPLIGYSVMYFLLGAYLPSIDRYSIEKNKIFIVAACIVLSFIQIIICLQTGDQFLKYTGYDSPLTVVWSVLIYVLFIDTIKTEHLNENTLWKIDRLCFGVYLIHPFFINVLYKVCNIYPVKYSSYYVVVILVWICVVIASFLSAMFLSLIPFFKKYIL